MPEAEARGVFQQLFSVVAALVPEGQDVSEHLTALVQTKGKRGQTTLVAYVFHLRSPTSSASS